MPQLSDIRYICLEIGVGCDLSHTHTWCPSGWRETSHGLPLMSDETIEKFCRTAARRGFKGLFGFHYYNEPLLFETRMLNIVEQLRDLKFVLWTNGRQLKEDSRKWFHMFDQISISLYSDEEAERIRPIVAGYPQCHANPAPHDDRLQVYITRGINCGNCIRPATIELPIDAWGRMHLCCTDFNCHFEIGNIQTQDHDYCINQFLALAEDARQGVLPFCWSCRSLHSPAVPQ